MESEIGGQQLREPADAGHALTCPKLHPYIEANDGENEPNLHTF